MAAKVFGKNTYPFVKRHLKNVDKGHYPPVVYATKFLGGMNFAFCCLNFIRLYKRITNKLEDTLKNNTEEHAISSSDAEIIFSSGLAHSTQFLLNIESFYNNLMGYGNTNPFIFTSEMKFIFLTDFLISFLNFFTIKKTLIVG
ncbi:hypothetical protein HK099_004553 [Clydaea vesicula]|uniref:Uncharacterized protein n=1 Tax=Clydaea vesicula TaxID=447962 RepID=A0AAD5U321_9FUNG|nr:hypothetical protein HK099_004553 [Clydaea vesicula]